MELFVYRLYKILENDKDFIVVTDYQKFSQENINVSMISVDF